MQGSTHTPQAQTQRERERDACIVSRGGRGPTITILKSVLLPWWVGSEITGEEKKGARLFFGGIGPARFSHCLSMAELSWSMG